MTQVPVGAAGVAGTGFTEGVHPARVTVAMGVRPESETVTLQSGAEKPLAWIVNCPRWSERTPAELVAERAMTKIPGAALLPCTRSCPPFSSPLVTVTADAPSAMASWPPIAQRAAVVTRAARIMRVTFMGTSRVGLVPLCGSGVGFRDVTHANFVNRTTASGPSCYDHWAGARDALSARLWVPVSDVPWAGDRRAVVDPPGPCHAWSQDWCR